MKQLGRTNYALISGGVKDFGTYDPKIIACAFEEALYADEAEEVMAFLAWVHEDEENRAFGHGNYEARFCEFKLAQNIKTAVKKTPVPAKKGFLAPKMDFSFWRDNKINQHYLLTREQLTERFKLWLAKQKKEWLDYYSNIDTLVAAFVGQKDGLNSVTDLDKDADGKNQFDYLCEHLKETRNDHFYKENIWKKPEESYAAQVDSLPHKRLETLKRRK